MKIAFTCCIHGNIEALKEVGKDIESQQCDKVYCLGDVVGYGAYPHECIQYVRERKWPTLMGNHEDAVLHPNITEVFMPNARHAIYYTLGAVTNEDKKWMATLPISLEEPDFQLVHGSPAEAKGKAWQKYILTVEEANDAFAVMKRPWCFVGHTHIPAVVFKTIPLSYVKEGKGKLDKTVPAIVNVGTVGQPRDKDPRAGYAILDTSSGEFEIRRITYDIEKVVAEMLERGLPAKLAERLRTGV
jgi:predicted phosphodiesterase